MKEKNLKIKLADGHYLYGKFSGSFDDPLFIVLHGLSGDMEDEMYASAVKWFHKKKYATFRFNLYSFQSDARQLMNSTIKTQAADLDAVIKYFRKKGTKKIYVAGHSFAGPVILSSMDQGFEAAVLWDPTYDISFTKSTRDFPSGQYLKEIDAYAMHWGINIIISRELAREVDSFPWKTITKDFTVPLKIIVAGNGELKNSKQYLAALKVSKEFVIMKGASHCFDNSIKIRELLYKSTQTWFEKN